MDTDTPELLRRGLRNLQVATAVLYVVLILAVGYFWWDSHRTKDAVCSFRSDLVARTAASEKYLADHPEGVFGLSAAQIRSSLDSQRRTIAALGGAGC